MKYKNKFLSSRMFPLSQESDEITCAKSLAKESNPLLLYNQREACYDLRVLHVCAFKLAACGAGEGKGEQAAWGGVRWGGVVARTVTSPSNTQQPKTPPCLVQNTCQEPFFQKGPHSLPQGCLAHLSQNCEH